MKTNAQRGGEREPEKSRGEAGKTKKGSKGGAACATALVQPGGSPEGPTDVQGTSDGPSTWPNLYLDSAK